MIILFIATVILLTIILSCGVFSFLSSIDAEPEELGKLILIISILVLSAGAVFLPFYGFHSSTGSGEHLGYITASETTGVMFKTDRIYFKTSLRSSQEDKYCVIDKDVYKRLQKVKPNQQIDIYYESYLANGIKNCAAEKAVITGFGVILDSK